MMRFLFVEHHPVFGGPHNQALRLANPLKEHGWETSVLLPDEPGSAIERLRAANIPVLTTRLHRVRKTPDPRTHWGMVSRFPKEVGAIRGVIRDHGPDLVLLAGIENPHAAAAAALERVPLVWQINGTQTPPAFRRVMTPLARRLADVIMTTGTSIAAEFPGVTRMGSRWVPFFAPVNVHEFSPDRDRRTAARSELELGENDPVIGTVGNLNPQKGHATFLKAAAELKRMLPRARFIIFGARHDTHRAYEDGVRMLAGSLGLGLGRDLLIVAPEARVSQLVPALDVYWLSSVPRSEGVPTALSEAMALKIPAVVTDVGGTKDLVHHAVNGFVVQPFDHSGLASFTSRILLERGLAERLGEAARATVVARCSTEVTTEAHLEAFRRAIEHRAVRTARTRRTKAYAARR